MDFVGRRLGVMLGVIIRERVDVGVPVKLALAPLVCEAVLTGVRVSDAGVRVREGEGGKYAWLSTYVPVPPSAEATTM
jgi:hypothetical protein